MLNTSKSRMLHRVVINGDYYNHYRYRLPYLVTGTMKFLLYIWELSRKIQRRVTAFLQNKLQTRSIAEDRQCESHPITKFKRICKKKSFHSFLKEQDSSQESMYRIITRSYRRKIEGQQQRAVKSQKWRSRENGVAAGEMEQESRGRIEMTAQPVFLDSPIIFNDQNGLQISFIAQRKSIQEEVLDKDEESDSEILKFVYGSRLTTVSPRNMTVQKARNVTFQKDGRLWWQKVGDNNASQSSLEGSRLKNDMGDRCNPEEREGKPHQRDEMLSNHKNSIILRQRSGGQGGRRVNLCVINLIDLVVDEDCPRLFQIPLSIERL